MIPVETNMKMEPHSRVSVQWLGATLAAAITTAVLAWMGARATTAGMVFLVVVVWTATQAGLMISLYSALLCALSFDYFFLPPIHTLILAGPQEWVSMVTFAVSSLVAGRVAERSRRQARESKQRFEDVERLYLLSQEMMLHEDAARLIRDLPGLLERIFDLECVVLYVQDQDQFHLGKRVELTELFKADMRALTGGQSMGPADHEGFVAQPLMMGLRAVGALAWRPAILLHEVATAVTGQAAIALTRAIAIEANARMEASREGERLRVALIDSLTHELRTPLTSIRAAASTLVEGNGLDDATRKDLAAIVDEEASRLDALIGEAVEMAEIDANVIQVHATPQHARTLLEHTVEESHAALARHQVTLMVQEPDGLAWFDAKLLGRVFRHLIENAARYSPPEGRIVLRSRRVAGRLEFDVEDDGPGIDKGDLPLIFEKFYRGKKSSRFGKGTGMGLAIARAILVAHGGGIEVKSDPGEGATFTFWVPLVEKESTTALRNE